MDKKKYLAITSRGLFHQNLNSFFPEYELVMPSSFHALIQPDGVLAWGNKKSGRSAASFAHSHSATLLRIEDGFLFGLAPGTSSRMSLIIDDIGIYYDGSRPSRLEYLILKSLDFDQITRAQFIRDLWCEHGVSKYNHSPDWNNLSSPTSLHGFSYSGHLAYQGEPNEPFILVIDQTFEDQSVAGALADASSFSLMLDAALTQDEIKNIIIKAHPEVTSGKKRGYFDYRIDSLLRANSRIQILDQDVCLSSVISKAHSVYTVSSQAGFEALLWGKQVFTFGMPFYAGWGLTTDYLTRPVRRKNISIEQLIYAALISYSRYVNPHTNAICQAEDIIRIIGLQRTQRARFQDPIIPIKFSWNKRKHLKYFLQGHRISECKTPTSDTRKILKSNEVVSQDHEANYINLYWGISGPAKDSSQLQQDKTIQVEDGFIRSLGLGATLSTPYSWIFDQNGIYYDSNRPSDLELILQNTSFDDELLKRAKKLQSNLIDLGISKYNLPESKRRLIEVEALNAAMDMHSNKRFLLVIGQVESDASIRYGGVDVLTNADLLQAVRASNSDAFIIYKPHPDIVHSVRSKGKTELIDSNGYNLKVCDLSLNDCLAYADEVHTISSLSGFEALIRNIPVTCYGLPFYAGWGLTEDRHQIKRRTRKLNVLELIAGALILYPTYIHPRSKLYCTPEDLIAELHLMKNKQVNPMIRLLQNTLQHSISTIMGIYHRTKGI